MDYLIYLIALKFNLLNKPIEDIVFYEMLAWASELLRTEKRVTRRAKQQNAKRLGKDCRSTANKEKGCPGYKWDIEWNTPLWRKREFKDRHYHRDPKPRRDRKPERPIKKWTPKPNSILVAYHDEEKFYRVAGIRSERFRWEKILKVRLHWHWKECLLRLSFLTQSGWCTLPVTFWLEEADGRFSFEDVYHVNVPNCISPDLAEKIRQFVTKHMMRMIERNEQYYVWRRGKPKPKDEWSDWEKDIFRSSLRWNDLTPLDKPKYVPCYE